jgi:integrase
MSRRHTKPLSDPKLKGWVNARRAIAKSDGDGLTFTVSSSGYAAWILRYGFNGKRRELTLGRYPELSLIDARKRAREQRALIDQGKDVAAEKRRVRHATILSWTVAQVASDYEKTVLSQMAASTQKLHGGYIRNWLIPTLGSFLARDIQRQDVIRMLKAVSKRGHGAVKALHAATRSVFRHALEQGILEENPAIGFRRKSIAAIPAPRKGVALEDQRLGQFLAALGEDVGAWGMRFHLITGVRPIELIHASWGEFDLDKATWTVPAERTKTRSQYEIIMPTTAMALLHKIKTASGKSPFLFPAAYGDEDRPIPYQTYRGRVRRALEQLGPDFPRIKPHDLRRTMRSGLTRLNIRYEVAERAINHKLPAMAEIYDRNEFREDRRLALMRWADHMDQLEAHARGIAESGTKEASFSLRVRRRPLITA